MSEIFRFRVFLPLIIVLGVVLHWRIWNLDIMGIHAWRQTQTMTVVQNFAFEDMNILNPRINSRGDGDGIFRMEFPLMQWTFAWFYRWFGNDLTVARLLTFVISILSSIGYYRLLRSYAVSEQTSIIGAWCFTWSPVLFYYAVNPLPDNLALCLGIWSLNFLKRYQNNGSLAELGAFGILLSLATAVKLPFVLFGAGYIPLFLNGLRNALERTVRNVFILLLLMLPAIAWYAWVVPQWKNTALIGGISAESTFDIAAAVANMWGVFHSILPELLINYASILFFLAGIVYFFNRRLKIKTHAVELFISAAVLLYYVYEVNMIGLAHDYYLFPFLPLIFLLVTAGAKRIVDSRLAWLRYIGFGCLMLLPATAYLRANGRWTPMGNEKAIIKHKNELRVLSARNAFVVVGNDPSTHIFLYHIDKKGWTFEQNWLTAAQLEDYMNRGATHLYTNSDLFRDSESFQNVLGEPIFDKDGIVVYPLKRLSDS